MDRRAEIERLAYELHEKSGRRGGSEPDNWMEAERLINSCVAEMEETQKEAAARKAAKNSAAGSAAKIARN